MPQLSNNNWISLFLFLFFFLFYFISILSFSLPFSSSDIKTYSVYDFLFMGSLKF